MDFPTLLHHPVLPALCIYVDRSYGGPSYIMRPIPLISSPLAATLVATKICNFFSLNILYVFFLSGYGTSPDNALYYESSKRPLKI